MKMIVAVGLCAGLLAMAAPAKAQFVSGYLLTKRGDTIRGYLRPPTARTMAQSLVFRQQPASPDTEIKYQLKQLQSVSLLNGKTYVVQKLQPLMGRDTLRVLFQPLTTAGPIHLYRLDYDVRNSDPSALAGSSFENVFYFLRQGTNAPVRLEAASFRALFKDLFLNCRELTVSGRFDEANLIRLVSSYNACLGFPGAAARP